MKATFTKVEQWIYRNARPVDLARWRYHFEGGARADVYRALAAYQNADGGFGHALEADSWNPHSSPITTATAVELMGECGGDAPRGMVEGMLRYLDGGDGFSGGLWRAIIESNNDAPHAPWWTFAPGLVDGWGYNPSALLAGFVLVEGERDSELWKRAYGIAGRAAEDAKLEDQHETQCVLALLEAMERAGLGEELDAAKLRQRLTDAVGKLVERDESKWLTEYVCTPSLFVTTRESFLYPEYHCLLERELDLIEDGCAPDGVWDITWKWADYEREFAVSENWWRGVKAVNNVLLLRRFGRM